MKKKVFIFLNYNRTIIGFIYTLIIVNVIALILESFEEIGVAYSAFFNSFEIFTVLIFSIEYILRIWTAEYSDGTKSKYLFSFLGIIDLVAIVPFYLPLLIPFDLRIVRILRLFRLLRIFKLERYSKSLKVILEVLKETKSELAVTFFIAFVLLVLSSTLMFFVESEVQSVKFASIGHAFWWAVATLTTVGYGDVYPITAAGKFLSAVIALIGIGFVALPTGIISSAFVERIQNNKRVNQEFKCKCPNCGAALKTFD